MAQALENEVRNWIVSVSKENVSGDLAAALKSGVVLCKVINSLRPGMITKINDYNSLFRQAENIQAFTASAKLLGVADADLFTPEDVQQQRNMPKVLVCLASLAQLSGGFSSSNVEAARAEAAEKDAANAANPTKKVQQLSLFEQQQVKAQANAQSASRGNIMKGGDGNSSYSGVSTMSFAEASMAKAQKEASKANTNANARRIVQVEGGAGANSFSMVEAKQMETQKLNSSAHNTKSGNVRASGKHVGGFSMAESKQMEAQKLASGALNTKHNVARVGDAGAGSNSFSMTESKQMEAQKLNSSAHNSKHNVARVGDAGAGANVLSMAEAKQMEAQKLSSANLQPQNNLIRVQSNSSGPIVNATPQ